MKSETITRTGGSNSDIADKRPPKKALGRNVVLKCIQEKSKAGIILPNGGKPNKALSCYVFKKGKEVPDEIEEGDEVFFKFNPIVHHAQSVEDTPEAEIFYIPVPYDHLLSVW